MAFDAALRRLHFGTATADKSLSAQHNAQEVWEARLNVGGFICFMHDAAISAAD